MEKKNKIVISIIVIVFIIIISILTYYIKKSNEINNLNNMFKDIDIIEKNIEMYYLDNSSLPIKGENINFKEMKNPNDNFLYYEIDLNALGNLDLTYGKERFGDKDFYIINQNSHTIYYYKGIKYNKEKYYTRDINYQIIDLENYK